MNYEQTLNLVFIFLVTAVLGSILGISVLKTVDTRLSDLSIVMPEINVPPSQITLPPELMEHLKRQSLQAPTQTQVSSQLPVNILSEYPNMHIKSQSQPQRGGIAPVSIVQDMSSPYFDNQIYRALDQKICRDNLRPSRSRALEPCDPPISSCDSGSDNHSTSDWNDLKCRDSQNPPGQCNQRYEKELISGPDFVRHASKINNSNQPLIKRQLESQIVSQVIPIHPSDSYRDLPLTVLPRRNTNLNNAWQHQSVDVNVDSGCSPSTFLTGEYNQRLCDQRQYYRDPREMTRRQFLKFKYTAKFDKMTSIDYHNWLLSYLDTPNQLPSYHRNMLNKIKQGYRVRYDDLPINQHLPESSREYYKQLIKQNILVD